MATPYGGNAWMANAQDAYGQAAQAMLQQLMMWLQQQQSSGYVQQNPMQAPASREQAMMSIWNARKDIRDMYTQWWGEDVDPIQAMENWATITTEEGAKDPVSFATIAGYIKPNEPGAMLPTVERQLGEGNLGLQYLNLLSSQSGPQDWIKYWNTTRNAAQTNLPAWAQALANNQNLPAFQGPTTAPPGYQGSMPSGAAGGSVYGAMPNIAPTQITPQQFGNLLPSEQAGLQGMIESQGGYVPDYLQQMMAAWPTGRAGKRTVWG